jgi:hypothetical protein
MPDVLDYRNAPLGSQRGEEHLQAPYNQRPSSAIIRVRNMSTVVARRVIIEAVSYRRGGEKSITEKSGPFHKIANASVDALRFKVAQGENMNWEDMRVEPQDAVLRHDGKRFLIEYKRDMSQPETVIGRDKLTGHAIVDRPPLMGEPGDWVAVSEGLWDLYMGNWERMHSGSEKERIDEIMQVNGRALNRFVVGEDNPYGYLEFSRDEIRIEEAVIDNERIRAGSLIEI